MIRLKYGRYTLSWDEFFFDMRHSEELHDYLAEHRQFHHRPGEGRPTAIVLRVWKEKPLGITRRDDWQIRCTPVCCQNQDGEHFELHPTLYTRDRGLAERLHDEEYVLACAIPTLSRRKPPLKAGRLWFVDLQMTIVDRSQVCRMSPIWDQL